MHIVKTIYLTISQRNNYCLNMESAQIDCKEMDYTTRIIWEVSVEVSVLFFRSKICSPLDSLYAIWNQSKHGFDCVPCEAQSYWSVHSSNVTSVSAVYFTWECIFQSFFSVLVVSGVCVTLLPTFLTPVMSCNLTFVWEKLNITICFIVMPRVRREGKGNSSFCAFSYLFLCIYLFYLFMITVFAYFESMNLL